MPFKCMELQQFNEKTFEKIATGPRILLHLHRQFFKAILVRCREQI
jgi:hypothetical protein